MIRLKLLLDLLLPPKESAFTRGYNWAKGEIESGKPREDVEAYLCMDSFDKGAIAYLRGDKLNDPR